MGQGQTEEGDGEIDRQRERDMGKRQTGREI
jgi:hypothetical protein